MSFIRSTMMTAYKTKMYPNYWDIIALLFVLASITFFAYTAKQMATPYHLGEATSISLDAKFLPFYAARTVVRMLIALCFSLFFTFTFATWAAKNAKAEKIIIPTIDVLQSVPILGFLSVTVAGFIGLFPNSMLGPECAAIFAIFTSQAWNMALGFYQTVKSVPSEVREAARMFHLSSWQSFWRIDVPFSMQSLLWNTMASMSAGWFFVVASEAITVSNQTILLPGIGSYIAVAIKAADLTAITYAILAMLIVILIYDQLLFRPLLAWAERFKPDKESSDNDYVAESWVIDLFTRTRLIRKLGKWFMRAFDAFVNLRFFRLVHLPHLPQSSPKISNWLSLIYKIVAFGFGAAALLFFLIYIRKNFVISEILYVFLLGLITAFRVVVMIFICSLIWVPVGVWIGLRPRVSSWIQPLAQILAAFPANLLYPFIVIFIVAYQLNPNLWLTPLMILGSQWYILFNVIAGASSLPKDLLQVADNLDLRGTLRWRRLLLPGILPYYVTGAITAAGGAWNASIVAEVASWGNAHVKAMGLGAYITEYTAKGSFAHLALGISMMCILVLVFSKLVWRPLYHYSVSRFSLE